jgi:hypothetical protein
MKCSLFAFQVILPIQPGDALRAQLHEAILLAPQGATFEQKRRFHGGVAALLLGAAPRFVWGNWDYTNDPDVAEREYERWCQGTVADARERRLEPSPGPHGAAAEPRYMFVTMVYLLERGGSCDQLLERATTMPEGELWLRRTFARLLRAIPTMSFVSVAGGAIYLCPGADEHGLTEEEVRAEKYSYLHRLT